MKKLISACLLVSMFFLSGCGTILKPYQVNNTHSDQLDITIVVLDSLGLLFFIIPGVIALTIDYMNGTLYLPKGKYSLNDIDADTLVDVLSDNGYQVSKKDAEAILAKNMVLNSN